MNIQNGNESNRMLCLECKATGVLTNIFLNLLVARSAFTEGLPSEDHFKFLQHKELVET